MFSTILLCSMVILGFWSLVNIIYWQNRKMLPKSSLFYFWQMNGLWNLVILCVAFFAGILVFIYFDSINSNAILQHALIRLVAIKIITDIIFISIGLYLENRGKRFGNERYEGYGNAIQLQGSFLFFFISALTLALLISKL